MLGLDNAAVIDAKWAAAKSKTQLPMAVAEFFAPSGPLPVQNADRRTHPRHFLRCRALIHVNGETHAIYLQDVSRTGIGLLSPVQLFPCQRIVAHTGNQRRYTLEVKRCRRVAPNCYECGTTFVLG